jgi:hypothetical protein
MADESESDRIKKLQALCEQLDALRQQAEDICKDATAEIRRAQRSGQRERRSKTKKVKRDRRGR